MASILAERREVEHDLREALQQGDPTGTGLPTGVCGRWTDQRGGGAGALEPSHRGRLAPDLFIGVAEERGLIDRLGEWVFEAACRTLRQIDVPWIAVNVSAVQLRRHRFCDWALDTMARMELDPRRMQIEITESLLLDASEGTLMALQRLRRAGVRIALDDFGTGYSSLSYLRHYNVDKLKVDRSFVAQLGASAEAGAIVRAIIELARALKLGVTAEGVETEAQRDFLVGCGCTELQATCCRGRCRSAARCALRPGRIAAARAPALVLLPVAPRRASRFTRKTDGRHRPTTAQEDLQLLRPLRLTAGIIAVGYFRPRPQALDQGTQLAGQRGRHHRRQVPALGPDHGAAGLWLLSEETADTDERLGKSRVFVVDPIDGRGASSRARLLTVSLAVVENGVAIAGVVFAPARDEMYEAALGDGARLNGAPLQRQSVPGRTAPLIPAPGAVHQELQAEGLEYSPRPRLSLARLPAGAGGDGQARCCRGPARGAGLGHCRRSRDPRRMRTVLRGCVRRASALQSPEIRHGALAALGDASLKAPLHAALIRSMAAPLKPC